MSAPRGTKYTGKPCRICGGTVRYRSNRACVDCATAHPLANVRRLIKNRRRSALRLGEAW